MNKDQRKFLAIALIVAFLASADRLVRFYYSNFPVASVGECLKIKMFGGKYWKAIVLENDLENGVCTLRTEYEGYSLKTYITFEELRDADSERMPCYETAD